MRLDAVVWAIDRHKIGASVGKQWLDILDTIADDRKSSFTAYHVLDKSS